MAAANPPIFEVRRGTKDYGGIRAINEVDITLRAGEIHALVGENGAGKSTLAKAIAGAITLSSGSLLLDGKEVNFRAPSEALQCGIVMVYQETSLVPTMTVAQNLQLGCEAWLTRNHALNISAQQSLQSLNFNVDPSALVEQLGAAQRQMVEIARAVRWNARIIIFDEPTASLTPEEIQHLFHLLSSLRDRGVAIIFISHALEETLRICDHITILRDGEKVQSAAASTFDRRSLVRQMVGRDIANSNYVRGSQRSPSAQREQILSIENVTMGSIVKNMSFSVYAGEVVAITGLIGSGRTEIAKIVTGVLKRNLIRGGMIFLRGRPIRYRTPKQAINDGIVYITEDRKVDGFFETMPVDDNIYLARLASQKGRSIFFSRAERRRVASQWIAKLSIQALRRNSKVIEYSGGNQQKVVIARALVQEPDVIFLDEPTRGVDVGAIPQIHALVRQLASEGKAVVVISSYLPEVLGISDRILVARGGRIVEEFDTVTATEEKILYAAVH
ncbi:MAG: sugar ABC transporter ATP-binding protein [Bradyrhizobium sp.]|nr:sugar ABC transporter ATP-binding protein [Bradyrhizobium sp.]